MKKLEFSTTSWHYRLINFTDSGSTNSIENICDYTRSFLVSIIKLLLIASFALFLFIPMTSSLVVLLGKVFGFQTWHWMIGLVAFGAGQWLGIGIMGACFGIVAWKENRRYSVIDKEPGPLSNMYRSWKDKTCVQIEFK